MDKWKIKMMMMMMMMYPVSGPVFGSDSSEYGSEELLPF
jgi:hypothetical protein